MQYRSPLKRFLSRLLQKVSGQGTEYVYVFEQVRESHDTEPITAPVADRQRGAQSVNRGPFGYQPEYTQEYPDPGPFRPYGQPRLTVDGQRPQDQGRSAGDDPHRPPSSIPTKERAQDLAALRVMQAAWTARPELLGAFPFTGERPALQLARVLGEDRSRAADVRDGITAYVSGLEAKGERVELDRFRSDLAGLHRAGDEFGSLGAATYVPAHQLENPRGASGEPGQGIEP
jgi:hypothetical protein